MNELEKVCKKFDLVKCVCENYHKRKNTHRCSCGKVYCSQCYTISSRNCGRAVCKLCRDIICTRCESDNCVVCGDLICIKLANALACHVLLCAGCEGRICCYADRNLSCGKCMVIYCGGCMSQHPCKPLLHSCGDCTYLGDTYARCTCGLTTCNEHAVIVRKHAAHHSITNFMLAMSARTDIPRLPRELYWYIWRMLV
jgi:hypothetical protein